MKILVTGGTGTVGSQVAKELLARKVDISVLTRDASKALPAGVKAIQGNLQEVATVRRVFAGFDAVFLLNVVGLAEASEGLMALTGMRLAGVKRVVYLSVHHADKAAWLPHFGSKVGIEEALKVSGIPFTILRPNNFYQNDNWVREAILQHGVYAQPYGDAGMSRVDVRDIAEAAAIALTEPGHEGETYDLVGPEILTATKTAEIWSRVLGRPIAYAGNDLDAWEQQAVQYMPAVVAFDFREMFQYFQDHGLKASPEAIARQTKLLGHAPRAYEPFVRETAAAWNAALSVTK